VNTQRQEKKRFEAGLKTAMTDEKLQHLSDMDFQWSVLKERNGALWNQRYEELREFKDEHGHCRVPWTQKSVKLAQWVTDQRKKRFRDARSEEKTAKLEAVGFFGA
jgi:hypothetical protein